MLNLQGMFNVEPVVAGGETAEQITIQYASDNQTRYEYDTETGKYFRFKDGVKILMKMMATPIGRKHHNSKGSVIYSSCTTAYNRTDWLGRRILCLPR